MEDAEVLYPPVEPYVSGLLDVGDGQQIYWEECGNPDGKPVVYLHGGPGGGSSARARRLFDPSRYRIVLLDQRGCGRSLPHAGEPDADLSHNTTWHLVADLELLREARRLDRWQLFGSSWGSMLALAYAERHPERVTGLVLGGILTMRRRELDWYYNGGAAALFPERYEAFLQPIGGAGPASDTIAAYAELLSDPDRGVCVPAAVAWSLWEAATVTLVEDDERIREAADPRFALALARIENHYVQHAGWCSEGQLVAAADQLAAIPGIIVQGRYDVVTPAMTAYDLARSWPGAELQVVPDSGHVGASLVAAMVAANDRFAS